LINIFLLKMDYMWYIFIFAALFIIFMNALVVANGKEKFMHGDNREFKWRLEWPNFATAYWYSQM
jgi:hypothetical protein